MPSEAHVLRIADRDAVGKVRNPLPDCHQNCQTEEPQENFFPVDPIQIHFVSFLVDWLGWVTECVDDECQKHTRCDGDTRD